MEAVAFVTIGEETHVTEYLRLERFGEEVFYVAKPRGRVRTRDEATGRATSHAPSSIPSSARDRTG